MGDLTVSSKGLELRSETHPFTRWYAIALAFTIGRCEVSRETRAKGCVVQQKKDEVRREGKQQHHFIFMRDAMFTTFKKETMPFHLNKEDMG